jgi:hypothetical protein
MPVLVRRVSNETLALMAQGYSNAAIAAMLVVTEATFAKARPQHLRQAQSAESHDQHAACSPSSPT